MDCKKMKDHFIEDVSTDASSRRKLPIVGRPRPGVEEKYVIMEEPTTPVMMHWRGTLVPHFRSGCPHCTGADDPFPLWYMGCLFNKRRSILELTEPCFETALAAAKRVPLKGNPPVLFDGEDVTAEPVFRGLIVKILRNKFARSPRVLRCEERTETSEWGHVTREELARIWRVPIRPKIFKGEEQA